jgi:aminopeptidase N
LGRKDGLQAISNGIEKATSKKISNGKIMTVTDFETTPKMSTYLVAFVVGPIEYIEKQKGTLRVRIYTPLGTKHLGKYALDKACDIVSFFETLYGLPYPLPKLDLIAIPDFAMGITL